ncbi:putative branched-chain amino acid permease (azaleucine resistance) [Burkholderiales bacterium JOSHI_001]|nr:putative branched-chain amino acid permease (azaleucine resistance) [Burkholderiales bacterium JOSHI_001]
MTSGSLNDARHGDWLSWQHWRLTARHPEFRRGAADMVGVAMGLAAWGLVTGVAMAKSGLGLGLAALMSLMVFAGTAQLAALPLIATGAPLWVIWATAACVNLRFVIFSAQWRPYLAHLPRGRRMFVSYFCADLNFALFLKRFPVARPSPDQLPYFWGGLAVNGGTWHLSSLLGIALAHQVPTQWGLGFAGTLALLGFTYSLLHDRGTWLAAVVAGAASVAAYALPLKLNIVVAIAAAVAIGVVLDHLRPQDMKEV